MTQQIAKAVRKGNMRTLSSAQTDLKSGWRSPQRSESNASKFLEGSTMEIQPDFRDLLALFTKRGVEYAIVGG